MSWNVDCVAEDTFLYASIANISAMGIFVKTMEPLEVGTPIDLAFAPPGHEPFRLQGKVAWINRVRASSTESMRSPTSATPTEVIEVRRASRRGELLAPVIVWSRALPSTLPS